MSGPTTPGASTAFRSGRRFSVWVLCSWLLLVTGCAVGPDYELPDTVMPEEWHSEAAQDYSPTEPLLDWWSALDDTVLTSLIWRAEAANLDLAQAVARIDEARALRGISKSDFWPQIGLGGSYTRTELSDKGALGQALPEGESFAPSDQWDVGFDASWELDFFGRIRRRTEAASAELEASVEDYRDVLVTLYAEVASNYVEVRSLQARIQLARANAKAQRETVKLTQDRFDAGLVSALDVTQAQSNLATTEAEIPRLETNREAALNRLAVLLAEHPGALHAELREPAPIPKPPDSLTVGLPGDLLRRRPDVRRAERELAAQTARIGVATADLFPTFSISGFVGRQAAGFDDLGKGSSSTWGIIPGFVWDIFTGGKIRNQINVEEARTEQLLYAYEKSVLFALEDVENAMVAYERERTRRDYLAEGVEASRRSVELVHTQYLSGITDFQRYLDSQRSQFNQEDQLAASEGLVVQNLIALNKAVGGGWSLQTDPYQGAEQVSVNGAVEGTGDSGDVSGTADAEDRHE